MKSIAVFGDLDVLESDWLESMWDDMIGGVEKVCPYYGPVSGRGSVNILHQWFDGLVDSFDSPEYEWWMNEDV